MFLSEQTVQVSGTGPTTVYPDGLDTPLANIVSIKIDFVPDTEDTFKVNSLVVESCVEPAGKLCEETLKSLLFFGTLALPWEVITVWFIFFQLILFH